jgi:hypothetical protein
MDPRITLPSQPDQNRRPVDSFTVKGTPTIGPVRL